ncbi:MAG TPA: GNAT family N-acetyltransferase [Microthrixaceae bacterium]|nr:GNAT family N-acetyltransferase [Microthrixaceae bacterium]
MSTDPGELTVRRCRDDDRAAVIALCRASLGWQAGDPNEEFFSWKHDANPFGASPAWVAETGDGHLVGLRVFLRWRFRRPDGSTFDAVRAVDTATHPDWQGKGIFTKLTLGALPDLVDDGVANVFNTPNDKSRPGYLKMGWQQLGRAPVAVRVRSLLCVPKMASARTGAEKWSRPTDVGVDAAAFFEDVERTGRLLATAVASSRICTDRTAEYLRWRYSFAPLHYRVAPIGHRAIDGVLVFRVRRRGDAVELTVCDLIASPGQSARRTLGSLLRRCRADYALVAGDHPLRTFGAVPAEQLGPVLTWRTLASEHVPTLDELDLRLGDLELF